MASLCEVSQVGILSVAVVVMIVTFSTLSVGVVLAIKSICHLVSTLTLFIGELTAAIISAITSALTVSMTVALSAGVAAFVYPASFIHARICIAAAVSATAVIVSATTVIRMTSLNIEWNVIVAIVSSAALAVAFAASWAIGVMSLIESETRKVGLSITSIMDAVRRNQYRLLQLLLKLQSNLSERDLNSALVCAVKCEYINCVGVLLDAGACPNTLDARGNTVLCIACDNARDDIVKVLLDSGAQSNIPSGQGMTTALHQSARWGYVECINLLLADEVAINARDLTQKTPLIHACIYAQHPLKVIRLLLDNGADVNMVDVDGQSSINHAAGRGLNLLSLLDAGGDAHRRDNNGDTAMHHACMSSHYHSTEGSMQNTTALGQLLNHGCDADVQNHQNNTAMHLAALTGYTEGVEMLLHYKANPNIPNLVSCLPIGYAATRGYPQIVCALIRTNSPLGPCVINGQRLNIANPLALALDNHNLSCAHLLAWAGCNTKVLHRWALTVCEDCIELPVNQVHYTWLHHHMRNVQTLQHLVRLVIRQCLSIKLSTHITTLPLPIALQGYLMMNDLYQECMEE